VDRLPLFAQDQRDEDQTRQRLNVHSVSKLPAENNLDFRVFNSAVGAYLTFAVSALANFVKVCGFVCRPVANNAKGCDFIV